MTNKLTTSQILYTRAAISKLDPPDTPTVDVSFLSSELAVECEQLVNDEYADVDTMLVRYPMSGHWGLRMKYMEEPYTEHTRMMINQSRGMVQMLVVDTPGSAIWVLACDSYGDLIAWKEFLQARYNFLSVETYGLTVAVQVTTWPFGEDVVRID